MELEGVVHNGVVVPDDATTLPEGTRVRISPAPLKQPRPAGKRSALPVEPRDDWERKLFGAAINCGVSVPDAALSSDGLYE